MKNWFGVMGRGRNRLHQDINRALAELGATFRPTLTVVDATRVLVANGPVGGSLGGRPGRGCGRGGHGPGAVRRVGRGAAGARPAGAFRFIGEAEQRGLGRADLALVKELGTA